MHLKKIRKLMPYGSIKKLANKHKITPRRGWDVLQGRVKKLSENDLAFIEECKKITTNIDNKLKTL